MPESLPIHVVIEEDDNSTRVDPETGSLEIEQPGGGVMVQFNGGRDQKDEGKKDWFANLAEDIDPQKLAGIANELLDAIEADDRSRQGHLQVVARGLGLLGLKLEEPKSTVGNSTSASEGMSSVTNPLLLEAILKFWANARAELLPAEGPVKVAIEGDETAQEDELAEALERDMNFYLTQTASEYVPETSHMLLWGTGFQGAGFKRVYRCPMRRRPVSESVDVQKFIVSNTSKDVRSSGRLTLEVAMRPSVMKRMMHLKAYRDVTLTQPQQTRNLVDSKIAGIQGTMLSNDRPEDEPYTIYESQCELDLPEYAPKGFKDQGIPLPYYVVVDKDSREILQLRRDWNEDDEDAERRRLYVKFPYIPGPGFYGTGLLNTLGNLSAAMTAVDRESLDAGMFASFPGGLIDKAAVRQNSVNFRVAPGEFAPIELGGRPINQVVSPMPYKDVSGGLLTLREAIINQSKSLAGAAEITAGEGVKDIPVGSMLAQIEQATKVMAASHKDLHAAHAEEIELIIELFRENPEDFFRGVKKRKKFDKRDRALKIAQGVAPQDIPNAPIVEWDEQKFLQALDDYQLIPRSDPNTPSHLHRIAKAVAYSQIVINPALGAYFDKKRIAQDICRALKDDPNGRVVDPPPQQPGSDPATMKALLDYKSKSEANQIKAGESEKKAQLEAQKQAGEQEVEKIRLAREEVIHQGDIRQAEQEHQGHMAKIAGELQQSREEHQMDMQSHRMKHAAQAASHQLDIQAQQHQAVIDAQAARQKNEMEAQGHEQQMRHTDEAHSQQMKLAEKQAASQPKKGKE
jgi:hypothetical protein